MGPWALFYPHYALHLLETKISTRRLSKLFTLPNVTWQKSASFFLCQSGVQQLIASQCLLDRPVCREPARGCHRGLLYCSPGLDWGSGLSHLKGLHVRFWRLADVDVGAADVCLWAQSGVTRLRTVSFGLRPAWERSSKFGILVAYADEIVSVDRTSSPADHGVMLKLLAFSWLFVAGCSSPALAFDPVRVDQVKYTKQCPKCDLSEADLFGEDLRGANLQGAILIGVDLEKADLRQANLRQADLSLSFFWGSNREIGLRANAGGSILRGANLQGANLEEANLTGADLEGANLSEAKLVGANLQSANLRGTKLKNADLRKANLCGAIMPDGTKSKAGCRD